jgi:dienelactone hydrolase
MGATMNKVFLIIILSLVANIALAKMHKEEIVYRHGDTELKSYLFWDDAFVGKRGGILVMPERWGMSDYITLRAEMLAESGYVALAVDLYGEARVTRNDDEAIEWKEALAKDVAAWHERMKLAFDKLLLDENVDSEKIAAIGYSLGGTSVLHMASSGASIDGVVNVHGELPTTTSTEAGNIQSRILLLLGADDPYVSKEQALKVTNLYSKADIDWEMNIYGMAKHSFTNPYADGYGVNALEYQPEADQRAWAKILSFLENLFEDE